MLDIGKMAVRPFAALICAALIVLPGAAVSQNQTSDPNYRNPESKITPNRPQGPIYNPATKSYFALREDNEHGHWGAARDLAYASTYKGVRGRLAIVADTETHLFLERNFTVNAETWIGLQFFCKYRKLMWVSGKIHPLSDFTPWAKQWYRHEETRCEHLNRDAAMPLYYLPHDRGFHWQASGPGKGFDSYFVEYPTGKP